MDIHPGTRISLTGNSSDEVPLGYDTMYTHSQTDLNTSDKHTFSIFSPECGDIMFFLKCLYLPASLYGVTAQNIIIFAAVRTSNFVGDFSV